MVEGRSAYVQGDLRVTPSHHRMVTGGDDIVVHTPRSYLDPGPSAEIGTEDRYFYDTAHYSLNSEGPAFTQNQGGFENLPGQFGPNWCSDRIRSRRRRPGSMKNWAAAI